MEPLELKAAQKTSGDLSAPDVRDQKTRPHLVWVFSAPIAERLDNATWLDTTRELRKLGWRVTLIAMGSPEIRQMRGIDVVCIPRRNVYFLGQMFFHLDVVRLILQQWNDVDVVLFKQDSGIWLFPLRLLRMLRGQDRPQIVMDTRDLPDTKPGDIKTSTRIAYMKFNHFLANKIADGQTTITPRFAELVKIPSQQLWGIWPSGVAPEPFSAPADARSWPTEGDPIKLVYIGMLLENRHPLQLCEAVIDALAKGQSFELYIYGNGPEAEAIRRCAAGSDGRVKMLAPIAHEEVPEMLSQMHVGVTSLPEANDTKYAASSPIKMFEYMASGLPILATTNPCHLDVVGDSSFVFWIEAPTRSGISESLDRVWAQRDALQSMSQEAQEAAQHWTWEAAASKLDVALRNGLGEEGNSR